MVLSCRDRQYLSKRMTVNLYLFGEPCQHVLLTKQKVSVVT